MIYLVFAVDRLEFEIACDANEPNARPIRDGKDEVLTPFKRIEDAQQELKRLQVESDAMIVPSSTHVEAKRLVDAIPIAQCREALLKDEQSRGHDNTDRFADNMKRQGYYK